MGGTHRNGSIRKKVTHSKTPLRRAIATAQKRTRSSGLE